MPSHSFQFECESPTMPASSLTASQANDEVRLESDASVKLTRFSDHHRLNGSEYFQPAAAAASLYTFIDIRHINVTAFCYDIRKSTLLLPQLPVKLRGNADRLWEP